MNAHEQSIVDTRLRNPCATLEQIGRKYSVSSERIRQVLKKNNTPTKAAKSTEYKCNNCGKIFKGTIGTPRLFCSRKCWSEYHHVTLICQYCGQPFKRRISRSLKGQFIFCSRECMGKYVGRNYGFVAHPENIRRGIHATR